MHVLAEAEPVEAADGSTSEVPLVRDVVARAPHETEEILADEERSGDACGHRNDAPEQQRGTGIQETKKHS